MKKIGIVTFHNAHNYGAMLQVFALQCFLEKNSNVEIIDYRIKKIEDQYRLFRKFKKNKWKENIKSFISDCEKIRINSKRRRNFNYFMNEKLNLSRLYEDEYDLKHGDLSYDILITGSDQVWNIGIVGELSDIYTLNFGNKNIKRISYAASVGEANLITTNLELYKNKLEIIDSISVRESDAMIELRKILGKDVEEVLDPTLLLTSEQWTSNLEENEIKEKYILAYFVEKDDTYLKIVNYLAELTGLKIIHFEKRNSNYKSVSQSAYTADPFGFVNLIKNAEYVVATSFHATVFSILFHKKFFIVPHKKTGSRVTSLLNKLEITDRVFYNFEDFKDQNYNFETNWDVVEKNLNRERKKSIEFLNNSIQN